MANDIESTQNIMQEQENLQLLPVFALYSWLCTRLFEDPMLLIGYFTFVGFSDHAVGLSISEFDTLLSHSRIPVRKLIDRNI